LPLPLPLPFVEPLLLAMSSPYASIISIRLGVVPRHLSASTVEAPPFVAMGNVQNQ
jgi:hypothetical protein